MKKVKLMSNMKVRSFPEKTANALIKAKIAISYEDEPAPASTPTPAPAVTTAPVDEPASALDDTQPKRGPGRPRKNSYDTKILTAEV